MSTFNCLVLAVLLGVSNSANIKVFPLHSPSEVTSDECLTVCYGSSGDNTPWKDLLEEGVLETDIDMSVCVFKTGTTPMMIAALISGKESHVAEISSVYNISDRSMSLSIKMLEEYGDDDAEMLLELAEENDWKVDWEAKGYYC